MSHDERMMPMDAARWLKWSLPVLPLVAVAVGVGSAVLVNGLDRPKPDRVPRYQDGCATAGPARSVPPVRKAPAWTGGRVPSRLVELKDYSIYRTPPPKLWNSYADPVSLPREWQAAASQRAVLTVCEYAVGTGDVVTNCPYSNEMYGAPTPSAATLTVLETHYLYQVFESRTGRLLTQFRLDGTASAGACPSAVADYTDNENVPALPDPAAIGSAMNKALTSRTP